MDIRLIVNEQDGGLFGYKHHAKNVTLLCDYGCDQIIVENIDGSFEKYDVDSSRGIIRIEDISE